MRMLLITCVAVAAGATTFAGQAAADPPPPNLDGYTAVEATAFETYSAYATSGVQFLTPTVCTAASRPTPVPPASTARAGASSPASRETRTSRRCR